MTDGADEIPSASLYLASDAAAFMTWSAVIDRRVMAS